MVRVLICKLEVFILDEVFLGVDLDVEVEIIGEIKVRGIILVVIFYRLFIIKFVDRFVLVEKGRVREVGG